MSRRGMIVLLLGAALCGTSWAAPCAISPHGPLAPAEIGLMNKLIARRSADVLKEMPVQSRFESELPALTLRDGSEVKVWTSFFQKGVGRKSAVEGRVRARYRNTVTNPFFNTPAGLEVTGACDTGHNPAAAVQVNYRVHPTTRLVMDVTKKGGESIGNFLNTLGGRAAVEVNSELVSGSASKSLTSGRIDYTALLGGGGWAGGLKGTIDTNKLEKNVDTNLALQYTDDTIQIGVVFSNDLDEYAAQFSTTLDADTQVAGRFGQGKRGIDAEVGVQREIDDYTSARAVIRSNGMVGASFERLLGRNIDLKLGVEVDSGLSNEAMLRRNFRRAPLAAGMQMRLHF